MSKSKFFSSFLRPAWRAVGRPQHLAVSGYIIAGTGIAQMVIQHIERKRSESRFLIALEAVIRRVDRLEAPQRDTGPVSASITTAEHLPMR